MIKRTNQEIIEFFNMANNWLQTHNDKQTKFSYALAKVTKRASRLVHKYQEETEDVNLKHCAEDSEGIVRRDPQNNYLFTKEGMLKRNKERLALFSKQVEIEPFIVDEVPEDLGAMERETFEGLVLKPSKE